ncbi:MAG: hypothetical protein Q4C87_10785 [Actinomycetaceae bacterium]|nr:hypothetical protein [Actinomycetaceae bacterium]
MLTFTALTGNDYKVTPNQIPELNAHFVDADDEHPDVGFHWENIGVGVFRDNWLSIEDLETPTLEPHHFQVPYVQTIIDIAHLLDARKIDEIMATYPWKRLLLAQGEMGVRFPRRCGSDDSLISISQGM